MTTTPAPLTPYGCAQAAAEALEQARTFAFDRPDAAMTMLAVAQEYRALADVMACRNLSAPRVAAALV